MGQSFAVYGDLFYRLVPPDRYLSIEPKACFGEAAEAEGAGYYLAVPGPVVSSVGDVDLAAPAGKVHEYCSAESERLGFPIICPGLAPTDWMGFPLVGGCWPRCDGMFSIEGQFTEPQGEGIHGSGQGHLIFWSAKERNVEAGFLGCVASGRAEGRVNLSRFVATWVTCPSETRPDSGHVLLEWKDGEVIHAVSVHGDSPLARQLALAMAGQVEVVGG